jgi:hypothetical protein
MAHFFARLRYDVDARTPTPDYAALGMGSEDMRQHIHKIELIGKDPEDGDISIYLFEVRSVTAKLRNDVGMLDIRNKAAHDEVLSRDEAQQTRAWAMQILEQV